MHSSKPLPSRRCAGLAALALLAAGCSFEASTSGRARCTAEAPACPGTTVCQVRLGLCVDGAEREAPVLSDVALAPAAGTRSTTFTLRFTVSEPLLVEPAVWAVFERGGRQPFTVVSHTDERWVFSYQPDATTASGLARAVVEVFDRSGNFGVLDEPPSFLVDAQPPRASIAAVSLEAPRTSPLSRPQRLGPTVTGFLSFAFDEPVADDVVLSAEPPVLSFAREDAGTSQHTFRVRLTGGDGGLTEPVAISVRARDTLGNETRQPLQLTEPLVVDDRPVTSGEDAVLERAPFGTDAERAPHFAVRGVTEPQALVRVLTAAGTELARVQADADGGFTAALPPPDRTSVLVDFTDLAANSTTPAALRRVRLELVPSDVAEAATPGEVLALGAVGARLTRADGDLQSGQTAAFDDGQRLAVRGEASWRRLGSDVDPPISCAMTAHEARSTVLAFGGGTSSLVAEHSEYVDRAWRAQQRGPTVRTGASYAYDRARDVAVLFGGINDSDVWEWDGEVWRLVPERAGDPLPRRFAAMATDPLGVVLFGGVAAQTSAAPRLDAWQRVERSWRRVDAGTLPLHKTAAAFDLRTRRTLVLGQAADGGVVQTAWWDGAALALVLTADAPPSADGLLGFDTVTGVAHFLASLPDAGAQAWAFEDGGWWRTRPDTLPLGGRTSSSGAWDPASRELVSCGQPGQVRSVLRYSPLDGGYSLGSALTPKPPGRSGAAWVALPDAGVVVTGGQGSSASPPTDELWLWAQGGWQQLPGAGLSARNHQHAVLADGGLLTFFGERAPLGTSDFVIDETVQQALDGGWVTLFDRHLSDAGPIPRINRPTFLTEASGLWMVSEGPSWRWAGAGWTPGPPASFTGGKGGSVLIAPVDAGWFALVGGTKGGSAGADDFVHFALPLEDGGARWLAKPAPEVLKRTGLATWRDDVDGQHYVFGGVLASAVYRGDVLQVSLSAVVDGGLLLDAGVDVRGVAVSDAEGDGQPGLRQGMAAWFDPLTRRPHVGGGRSDSSAVSDTWALEHRAQRPGLQLRFPVAMERSRGVRLTLTLTVGGTGVASAAADTPGGAIEDGVLVSLWRFGRWEPLGMTLAPAATPGAVSFSAAAPTLDELLGPGGQLVLQVATLGVNGIGQAELVLDAAALRLEQD